MPLRNEYDVIDFKRYKDGSVFMKALSDLYVLIVDATIYREEGEDPLIKARVNMEYRKEIGGESREVFVDLKGEEISLEEIHEAIEEFQYGPI